VGVFFFLFLKKQNSKRLVDLIQYDETKAVLQSEESPMETEDTEGIFFDYLSATYRQFMDGIDDTSELDAKFSAQFEDKNRQIEEECSQLERANSVLQKDISRLEQHATQLPALRKQKNGLQDDLAKFTEFVSQLEAYEDKTQRKLAHFEKDLAAKKKRLEALQKEKEVLGGRLAEQIAAGIDCAKLMQEQRDLEEKLVQLREKKGMAGKMRGEQEIAMQKLLEVVESELRQYNELAMRLRLVPASANTKMPDVAFEVGFKSHARAEEMVSGDLAGTIKPALKVLRNQLSSNNRALAVELQSLQEEAERLTEQVEAKQEDVQMLQAKVEQQENALKAMKGNPPSCCYVSFYVLKHALVLQTCKRRIRSSFVKLQRRFATKRRPCPRKAFRSCRTLIMPWTNSERKKTASRARLPRRNKSSTTASLKSLIALQATSSTFKIVFVNSPKWPNRPRVILQRQRLRAARSSCDGSSKGCCVVCRNKRTRCE